MSTPYFAGARVGDKVVCLVKGYGYIESVYTEEDGATYPIIARFSTPSDVNGRSYTLDGRGDSSDKHQCLFYAGTTINITPAPEPNREYVPRVGDVVDVPGEITPRAITGVEEFNVYSMYTTVFGVPWADAMTPQCFKNAKFLALYPTWQEAVNSKEFNCTNYMECVEQSLTCCKSVNQGHNYCGTCIFRTEQGK